MKQATSITKFLLILLISGVLLACGTDNNDNDTGGDGSNQPPTISGTPATTVDEGSPYHFAPTAADGDSGDTLTFSINNKPSWASFNSQTGILNGTPGLNDAADYDNIIISVSDGTATAELAAFMISVVNTNQPPTITGTPATTVNGNSPYHFAPTAADGDSGDTLTFTISNQPSWTNFDNQTGILNGTPGLGDLGDYSNIIISVSDGTATAELAAFMISVIKAVNNTNQPPTITGTPATTVNEDSPYHFAPTAADANSGDTLTFAISNKPVWANFDNQTGVLSGTPGLSDAGDYSDIIISVSDGTATAELAAFMISVVNTNQPPTITGTPATTVDGNSPYHFAPTAADGDSGDTLTFAISNKPAWANFDNQTGVLSGTPGLNDAGDYSNIIISVSDGTATAELAAFTISVIEISLALVVNTHSPAAQAAGTALHSNITITFNAALDATTVTGASVTLQGVGNTVITSTLSTNNQTITIDPTSDLESLTTYAVTITTAVTSASGAVLASDYSWNFTTQAGSPIPEIAQWEANMLTAGEHWGPFLANLTPEPGTYNETNTNYYDGQRVYFQIADYTGQEEPWNTYALEAKRIYMNYIENSISGFTGENFSFPGYRRFAQGIYMEYVRTGDTTTYENIAKIRDNPAFSEAGSRTISTPGWYWERRSREVAYALDAHIFAERAGYPRDEADVARYVTMALNHIKEWVSGEFGDATHRRAPFMFGLTSEALINFYQWELDNDRDPTALYTHASVPEGFVPTMTIPEALKTMADYLYDEAVVESGDNIGKPMWVADMGGTRGNWDDSGGTGYAAFRYEDIKKGEPAPDLNLLIAPVYAWLFLHYGDMKYITIADQLFVSGVNLPNLTRNTKIFNQNYRWSFEYIKWRNEGFAKWN